MFMPGSRMRFIEKAAGLDVDVVCMDLEDGVSGDAKDDARNNIREALAKFDFGRSDIAVRINSPRLDTTVSKEDMEAVLTAEVLPQTLCVPKVDTVEDLEFVLKNADAILKGRVEESNKMALVTMCESPLGLQNLKDILCRASDTSSPFNIEGVIFGGDDYAAEAGATRTKSNAELTFARQAVVAYCRAAGVQPLDIVHIDLSGTEQLSLEAKQGHEWGFAGKQIIHPKQIEPVQEAFSPSIEEINKARELLEAYKIHYEAGDDGNKGAFVFNGKMIDTPTVLIARNTIAQVDAIQKS